MDRYSMRGTLWAARIETANMKEAMGNDVVVAVV